MNLAQLKKQFLIGFVVAALLYRAIFVVAFIKLPSSLRLNFCVDVDCSELLHKRERSIRTLNSRVVV